MKSSRPSPRLHPVIAAGLALTSLALLGCSGGGLVDSADVAHGDDADSLAGLYGCDYSFSRPSPSHLYGEGYRFAVRYFSYDSGKNLTASEAQALENAGLDVVSNWEAGSDDALDGYSRGVQHAHDADAQAHAAGAPADRPIYFSVDFDASEGQQGAINDYMDGVASVIGRSRTGAYGGYYVIKRLFDAGKITWGWQAYAWSGGQWDPRAQARQIQNGLEGDSIDKDQAMVADIGQWSGSGGGNNPPPPPPPPASSCDVHSDGKLYCDNTDNSAMYASDNFESAVVNHLRTTSSWFKCWAYGEEHPGGNKTWYYTLGDDNGNWGWVPAVDLDTASSFDANPSAHGLAECAPSLPALPANCNVHSDVVKLYHCAVEQLRRRDVRVGQLRERRRQPPPLDRQLVHLLGHGPGARGRQHHLVLHARRRQRPLGLGARRQPRYAEQLRREPERLRPASLQLIHQARVAPSMRSSRNCRRSPLSRSSQFNSVTARSITTLETLTVRRVSTPSLLR